MPTTRMTKRDIERLPAPHPTGKQVIYWDERRDPPGWGVLVSGTTKAKTIIVQRKLPGSSNARRLTVTSFGTATDLEAARRKAVELLDEIRHGNDPKAARRSAAVWTLRRALDEYLRASKNLKPKTATGYREAAEHYLEPWLDLPLASITAEAVERRHAAIAAAVEERRRANAKRARRELVQPAHWNSQTGASTANGAMRVLRLLWNFVAERQLDLGPNPVKRLRRQWYAEPRRERTVKADDLPRFYAAIDALENTTVRDYLKLLLFTGLRRGEAASLRWDDVDFAARLIRLPASRTKSGRRLDLPMSSYVGNLLVARRAQGVEGPFVFPADSKSGHLEEPRAGLDPIAQATGIKISAHDLRRCFLTVAESTDISYMALRALANHSVGGQDVTAGYLQMTVERLREPAQRVGDRIMELCGIEQPATGNVAALR